MIKHQDPWYIHTALYLVVAVLVVILIQVAVVEPREIVAVEKYNKSEARLRMKNLREAQLLYFKKNEKFTNNLDDLISFINTPFVDSIRKSFDSLSNRPMDPFLVLTSGVFSPESLYFAPKTHQKFLLEIDTTTSLDSVFTNRGRFVRIDTTVRIGTKFRIEDPDGYGSIGDLTNDALKNTASWE
ncbi:MAG: hypothetical protein Q8N03_03470 [Ignavibacteria bacterium]|jgi:hypothetical protein|nr:hypothetical protein [Ignavibacteria bacterium]